MRVKFLPAPTVSLALLLALACAGCAAAQPAHGTLKVEAHVVVSGEGQPVSRETVYLLDDDLIRLAMADVNAGDAVQARAHSEHPRLRTLAGLMNARRFAGYRLSPDIALLVEQSRPIWERHVMQTTRTDDGGRAVFEGVTPGDYWVMCLAVRGGKLTFWNSRITVGRGTQEVLLDPDNALTVSDYAGGR